MARCAFHFLRAGMLRVIEAELTHWIRQRFLFSSKVAEVARALHLIFMTGLAHLMRWKIFVFCPFAFERNFMTGDALRSRRNMLLMGEFQNFCLIVA